MASRPPPPTNMRFSCWTWGRVLGFARARGFPSRFPRPRADDRAGRVAARRRRLGRSGTDYRASAGIAPAGAASPAAPVPPRAGVAPLPLLWPALHGARSRAPQPLPPADPGRAAAPRATGSLGFADADSPGLLRAARRRGGDRLPRRSARLGGTTVSARAYDVVIIGSGAGGGTVAQALAPLARAGRRVLVVERGRRFADDEFTGRELEMASQLYADGGGFLTAEGTMTLAFAHAYGGSTVVYTGTSLTAPERVIRGWSVPGLDYADLLRRSQRYLRENNVHLLEPERINENNRLFVDGGARAGYRVEQFPVNVTGCRGSSLCNLGCPNQAKQGTNRVQLPAAERAGAEVATRAQALRIEPDRVVVVRVGEKPAGGKGLPSEWAPGEYRVAAKLVVCAGGAIGSTALLLRSPFPA